MSNEWLERLKALVPPPARPVLANGDRAAARQAAGWAVPDHVFDVTEAYGTVAWLGWLQSPSPFSADDRATLANRLPDIEPEARGAPTLVAYTDPDGAWLFIGTDGFICVKSEAGVIDTGLPLAAVLHSWLAGDEDFGLGPPMVVGGHPPFAMPLFDANRPSRVTWLLVKPGARRFADRWAALERALGVPLRMASEFGAAPRAAASYFEGLELQVSASDLPFGKDLEQITLQHYVDRQEALRPALEAALAAAGMELVKVEGPRGPAAWWPTPG